MEGSGFECGRVDSLRSQMASNENSTGSFTARWLDDYVFEITYAGLITEAVIKGSVEALREKLARIDRPWALLFDGEQISRVAPDVRGPALELLRLAHDRKPVLIVGATASLPARMFAGTLSFALGIRFEIVEKRSDALHKIAQSRSKR
jgi:hypothetical protein